MAARGSRYGLASSVFSGCTARAVKIGEAIRSGMTNINDFGVNYLVQVIAGVRYGPLRACAFVVMQLAVHESVCVLVCR